MSEHTLASLYLPSGYQPLDQYLGGGITKGEMTLLLDSPGQGALRLWLLWVRKLGRGQRAVWMAPKTFILSPAFLLRWQIPLSQIFVIHGDQPENYLHEVLTSGLFDLCGLYLPERVLKPHQLEKIRRLVLVRKLGFVCLSHNGNWLPKSPFFSLVLKVSSQGLEILKARRRPAPFLITKKPRPNLPGPSSLSFLSFHSETLFFEDDL